MLGISLTTTSKPNDSPSSNSSDSSSSSSPNVIGPFPAGSYTFTTFLDTETTNCTSVSTYWQCPPSFTYHDNPTGAPSIYQWIVNGTSSDPSSNFTISYSKSPFAVIFTDEPLNLLDKGLESERYSFSFKYERTVIPSLGVNCFFPDTTFEANLYTKRPKSYPDKLSNSDSTDSGNSSIPFQDWKFAMDAKQFVGGGSTVPKCYHVVNGVKGAPIMDGITPQAADDVCTCVYKNYDPS